MCTTLVNCDCCRYTNFMLCGVGRQYRNSRTCPSGCANGCCRSEIDWTVHGTCNNTHTHRTLGPRHTLGGKVTPHHQHGSFICLRGSASHLYLDRSCNPITENTPRSRCVLVLYCLEEGGDRYDTFPRGFAKGGFKLFVGRIRVCLFHDKVGNADTVGIGAV